jgi:hypothetical protein
VRSRIQRRDAESASATPSNAALQPPLAPLLSDPYCMAKADPERKPNASAPGFEGTLCATAEKLRGSLDAAEYKHAVLGLIFETLRSANKRQSFCSQ